MSDKRLSPRAAAAAAARAAGRVKSTFEVANRPLVRNGRKLQIGTKIRLTQADANAFLRAGRIAPANAKPAPKRAGGAGKASKPKAKPPVADQGSSPAGASPDA